MKRRRRHTRPIGQRRKFFDKCPMIAAASSWLIGAPKALTILVTSACQSYAVGKGEFYTRAFSTPCTGV